MSTERLDADCRRLTTCQNAHKKMGIIISRGELKRRRRTSAPAVIEAAEAVLIVVLMLGNREYCTRPAQLCVMPAQLSVMPTQLCAIPAQLCMMPIENAGAAATAEHRAGVCTEQA
mmetsp:Transcript_25001/g.41422  ORF Transcript_25001/g.41422 Transcript_25001/m.41422 type:complete len:116 (+) Transcript_25001:909-1256(+)